jgi:uncharacterized protein YegP (UPF0339 family)
MKYRLSIRRGKSGWYWTLKHRNGKTLAHSEVYKTEYKAKQTATNIVDSFKRSLCILEV